MKPLVKSLSCLSIVLLLGCSGSDDVDTAAVDEQPAVEAVEEVSQAQTMEEIWASSLDPAEKARRVQELLARQQN